MHEVHTPSQVTASSLVLCWEMFDSVVSPQKFVSLGDIAPAAPTNDTPAVLDFRNGVFQRLETLAKFRRDILNQSVYVAFNENSTWRRPETVMRIKRGAQ